MVTRILGLILTAIFAIPAAAQSDVTPAKLPAWDVVSVRLNKTDTGPVGTRFMPDGLHSQRVRIRFLAAQAYGVNSDLVSGIPKSLDALSFDVDAKLAGEDTAALPKLSPDQRRQLVKAVLVARFAWQAHWETKELPVYELVVAKGGPKLTPSPPSASPDTKPDSGMLNMASGTLTGKGITMSQLANGLAAEVERSVIDKTGLTARFDLSLVYTSQRFAQMEGGSSGQTEDEMSLFTALIEQLGLKLQPAKGPVKVVVVDHVEMPTEN
jgi:uncharacterized protein (TIGR03435 family)